MKKVTIAIVTMFSLVLNQSLHAQRGLSVSVKGAPQFSWMNNSDDKGENNFNNKSKVSANFGVGAQYNFTTNLGVGLDVLYSLQGRKYDLSGTSYRQKNNYLKVPVYFAYTTNPAKKIAFTGKLGPQLSILTSSKLDGGTFNNTDTKDVYKNALFGLMADAGAQFSLLKNTWLITGIRYDYDITNAEDETYRGYPAGRSKTHNSSLGLEVGLKYQLK